VSVSAGVACFPEDGRTKDELVAIADRALYLVKPDRGLLDTGLADPYLRALDDTALALLDRTDQDGLLATILARASALLGTPHAWIDLLELDATAFVMRIGTGAFADMQGSSLSAGDGVAGAIVRTGPADRGRRLRRVAGACRGNARRTRGRRSRRRSSRPAS
jgi:hypothetical protein